MSGRKAKAGPVLHTDLQVVPVANLIPYARNSRTHSDAQVAQVAASIVEFGFTNPVLVDESGGVIAGHARILAARQLGIEAVPTIVLRGLTEAQRRAYVIADNRLALSAGWDAELLRVEVQDLLAADFDLQLLGFETQELSDILAAPEEVASGMVDQDQAYSPEEVAVTGSSAGTPPTRTPWPPSWLASSPSSWSRTRPTAWSMMPPGGRTPRKLETGLGRRPGR